MNIPCQMSFVSNWQHIFIDKIKDRGEGDFLKAEDGVWVKTIVLTMHLLILKKDLTQKMLQTKKVLNNLTTLITKKLDPQN